MKKLSMKSLISYFKKKPPEPGRVYALSSEPWKPFAKVIALDGEMVGFHYLDSLGEDYCEGSLQIKTLSAFNFIFVPVIENASVNRLLANYGRKEAKA